MRLSKGLFVPLILFAILSVSCMDFFTNSLAGWAVRDPENLVPRVNAGNIHEILEAFQNDPDASLVILRRIRDAQNGATPEELLILQSAALEAAINSAGLLNSILGTTTNLNNIDDEDSAKSMILDSIDGMKNLDASSALLREILPEPGTQAFDDFAAASDPNYLAMTAALLVAGEAKRQSSDDLEGFVDNFSDKPKTPTEELAMAMAEAAMAHPDELSDQFADALRGLNLVS